MQRWNASCLRRPATTNALLASAVCIPTRLDADEALGRIPCRASRRIWPQRILRPPSRMAPRRHCARRHAVGDKLFADFAGDDVPVFDAIGGETCHAKILVAVSGATNCAEACASGALPDWIGARLSALVPLGAVASDCPPQLKAGLSAANRYEPGTIRNYENLAGYYGRSKITAQRIKIDAASEKSASITCQRHESDRDVPIRVRARTLVQIDNATFSPVKSSQHLAWIHDADRVEQRLDGSHHLDRDLVLHRR